MTGARIDEAARRDFAERGLVLLRGLVPAEQLARVRDEIWSLIERHGAGRDGQWTAGRLTRPALSRGLRRAVKDRMRQSAACRALDTPALRTAVLGLTNDEPVCTVMDRPQVLFTPPDAERWAVPSRIWHLDVPRLEQSGCPGVQTFCCIDAVVPGGGGTVVVSGSHKLLNDRGRIASRDVKRRLAKIPWFRTLFSPGGEERCASLLAAQTVTAEGAGEVTLQVDVYLVDLRTLHSLAPNTAARPRLAATQRFFLESVVESVYAGREPGQR